MFLILFAIWIVLNARITVEICIIGLLVAGIGYAFACFCLGWSPKRDLRLARMSGLIVAYICVLVVEIIKSSLRVVTIILNSHDPIKQSLVTFETDLESSFARAILANSITLTPGTITVSVDGSCYTVHCLDRSMIDGIQESTFVHLLRRLEAK